MTEEMLASHVAEIRSAVLATLPNTGAFPSGILIDLVQERVDAEANDVRAELWEMLMDGVVKLDPSLRVSLPEARS